MAQPPTQDHISEVAPLMKTRTPETRDKLSMKARKGFRSTAMPRGQRAVKREFARKR